MEDSNYTNIDLGRDYLLVVSRRNGINRAYSHIRKKISEADIDIPGFYRWQRSLKDLKFKGVGEGTRTILELILEKGVNELNIIFEEEKTHLRIAGPPLPKNKDY